MIPLYGFLQGDVLGVLIFAYQDDTMEDLIQKLELAASSRVRIAGKNKKLLFNGQVMEIKLKVKDSGLMSLDMFEVVESQ